MKFPAYRPRRMRATEGLRKLVRETTLGIDQLIMPYFIIDGSGIKDEISSMPGQFRHAANVVNMPVCHNKRVNGGGIKRKIFHVARRAKSRALKQPAVNKNARGIRLQ